MSDTKWTPGPWKPHATGHARSGKPEHEIHWSDDGECIAEIVHGEPEARLIAAAPDLYEALDAALNMIEHSLTGLPNPDTGKAYRNGVDDLALTPNGSMTLLKARAIQAKARGKS